MGILANLEQVFQTVPAGSSYYTPTYRKAVKSLRLSKLMAFFILVLLLSPSLAISQAQVLTVGTDKAAYEPGEQVEISGTAAVEANITITVYYGFTAIFDLNVTADMDGNYSESITLPEAAENGTYTVIASSGGESANALFEVLTQDLEELAENLISQARELNESILDIFGDLGADIPSEANESYTLGVAALVAAVAQFDDGNFTEAADEAYDAIEHFGDAFRIMQDVVSEKMTDGDGEDDGEDEEESLAEAIERAFAYWDRLNSTVTNLSEDGYNVAGIVDLLNDTYEKLVNASQELLDGSHTGAVREFRAARSVLGRIHGFLQSKVKAHKEKKMEQFLEQFQNRITKINETIERVWAHLDEDRAFKFKGVLASTHKKIEQLRRRLTAGDADDILDGLDQAVNDVEEGLEDLNGKGFGAQIMSLNRVEAKIRVLNKTAQRLAVKGRDVSGFEDEIEEAESILDSIRDELVAGNLTGARDLTRDAESSFRELKKSLQWSKVLGVKERIKEKILSRIQGRLQSSNRKTKSMQGP